MQKQRKWLRLAFVILTCLAHPAQAQDAAALAKSVQGIFAKRCADAGCHGAQSTIKFNVGVYDSVMAAKAVKVKDPAGSKLLSMVTEGTMPLTGDRLKSDEVTAIRAWIEAGAPDWSAPKTTGAPSAQVRKPVTEKETLQAIVRDLESADERQRPFLRYYSLANLHNNTADVDDSLLALYRTSLSKLVNHLSWNPEIVVPKALGPSNTVLRIDLRDYDWTPAIWQRIVAAYPYGLRSRSAAGSVDQIKALSGVEIPCLRADWFVAMASLPPLYHEILQLPETVAELERRLNVDSAANLAQEKCARAGLRVSGVSRSNRVVERHRSAHGAYWKSYDFATNTGPKNIFLNPLNFREDGGEYIFNLPNGLQGYLIANSVGKRLDEAPISIVRDRTNGADNPVVRNGRSCIGCHTSGMNTFNDEVRPNVELQQKPDFDRDHALALYVPQPELNRLFDQDRAKFSRAVSATGSPLPRNPSEEPVNLLGVRYEGDVTLAQAAADIGVEPKELQRLIGRSTELERLGFGTLEAKNLPGIKRDLWEANFGAVIEELRLGDCLKPSQRTAPSNGGEDNRITVSIASFRSQDAALARRAQQRLFVLLNGSAELKVVTGRAEHRLQGEVTQRGDILTVILRDTAQNAQEEAQGGEREIDSLVQQAANRLHLRLTGTGLTARTGSFANAAIPTAAPAAADALAQLPLTLGGNGAVKIAIALDRGPGSVYRAGEPVGIRFRADRDCFLQIKNIDASGNVVNLFPNRHNPSFRVQAGETYFIGDEKGPLFVVDPNGVFGEESLIAFASLQEEDLPAPKSKTLGDRDAVGAGQFAASIKTKARPDRVASALVRFFTTK